MASLTIPYDLKSYGIVKLETLDVSTLRNLCLERNISINPKARSSTCVSELIKWKTTNSTPTPTKSTPTKPTKSTPTKSIPKDLSGYGAFTLNRLDVHHLRQLCQDRKLPITLMARKKKCIDILLEWKKMNQTSKNNGIITATELTQRLKAMKLGDKEKDKSIKQLKKAMQLAKKEQDKIIKQQQKELEQQEKQIQALRKQFDSFKEQFKVQTNKDGFTTRKHYRQFLERCGLDIEGQHVHHIIAAANGGCDHVDNFLFTVGASYNSSNKDNHDPEHCYTAGLPKVRKAIDACKLAEQLQSNVEKRNKKKTSVTYWSQGIHRGKTAEDLVTEGNNWYRDGRTAARIANK